ncbi:enoyl-CoA hydratase/isomerase family protein [Nocardia sp. CA2R105]|uniref:enoyl-CoA hydratase-related protein n=1 Tax=Nocardia coffeae TaxID=2873381 RepID=UPI001CA66BFC|nr:enoyl-CoA hydratase-related protein [Nocardia coffeae]MBY8863582.1 enoyl-CoA hydratase/isomerase family protein [Nocardia coffeae]
MDTATTNDGVLQTRIEDGVLVLTLNRPAARNALSPELVDALHRALDAFVEDDTQHCAVIAGRGRAFCAGLDLKVYAEAGADRSLVSSLIRRIGLLPKPLIGAVNGPAVAGGLEIALGCDWLVGSPTAMFADTHVRIGAFPGGGMTARLSRAVGARTAKAMSLGGLRLDADAALRAGLLSEIVDPDRLVIRATELASAIAAADHDLVQGVRTLIDQNADRALPEALAVEAQELQTWRTRGRTGWTVRNVLPPG